MLHVCLGAFRRIEKQAETHESEAEAQAFADDANAECAKELAIESKAERKALASELAAVVRGLSLERLRELEKWLGDRGEG